MKSKRRAASDIFREQNVSNLANQQSQEAAAAADESGNRAIDYYQQSLEAEEKAPVNEEGYLRGDHARMEIDNLQRERTGEDGPSASGDRFRGFAGLPASAPASNKSSPAQTLPTRLEPPPPLSSSFARPVGAGQIAVSDLKSSEELQLEKEPIKVRENGFWIWKRVIVPPNTYVVHTRMGRPEPVTIGLGVSFRYNPYTDAYLIVPAAMQTIGVVANCISREKQGINILAYVQWQIDDFAVAYRRLDFSDSRDPLGIVNAQLREQAEAAIKDKIATMSVEEVLTDKKPVIAELTTRLKEVAERHGATASSNKEGLGIKIVTVQIREAIVSSQRLWQDLQAPFRYEQETKARISYLTRQDEIRQKELQTRQATETREAETMLEIERIRQAKQTETADLRLSEESTRFIKEQETTQAKIQQEENTQVARRESEERLAAQSDQLEHTRQLESLRRWQEHQIEQTRLDTETESRQKSLHVEGALQRLVEENRLAERQLQIDQARLDRERTLQQQEAEVKAAQQEQADRLETQILEANLERSQVAHAAQLKQEEERHRLNITLQEKEVEIERLRQEIHNLTNEHDLAGRMIEKLPELTANMPDIHELKIVQTGDGDPTFERLAAFLSHMLTLTDRVGGPLKKE